VAFLVIALALLGLVVIVRRRRRGGPDLADARPRPEPANEAW
jgi:hypothetical protein